MFSIIRRRTFVSVCVVSGFIAFSSVQAASGLQIGVSGSVIGGGSTEGDEHLGDIQSGGHDPNRNGFRIPNVELLLGAAVDPYFDAQANLVMQLNAEGETIVELEEAFAVSTSLPAGLQLKAGQFYTEFGRHNPMHPHSWAFVDQPVIASRLLGGDGLRSQGARLSWLTPMPWYSEIFGGIQNANGETTASFMGVGGGHAAHGGEEAEGEVSFAEYPLLDRSINSTDDFLYSARWLNGLDLTDTLSTNLGLSALFGPNNTGLESQTQIVGADIYVKWQPEDSNKGFPFVAWHSEFMTRAYQAGDEGNAEHQELSDTGLFSYVQWGFTPGWVFGLRYELANGSEAHHHDEVGHEDEEPDSLREFRQRVSANLSYYPTEFSKVRLQYNNDSADHLDGMAHSVWLQLEYNIGAHMAHKFYVEYMKIVLLLGALLLSLGNASWASASLKIVTTTQDLAAITEAIGGKHVDVVSLTPGTRDPHFAEAKPSMIRRVFRADLLLSIGAEMEVGWLPSVLKSSRNRDVQPGSKGHLDLSKHVDILGIPSGPIDRSMGDVHGTGNPHYWLSPQNGLKMARAVSDKLVELDRKNASVYQSNFTNFETRLNNKINEWQQSLSYLKGKPVVAYHTSLLYLANAFGFDVIKELEPKPGIAPGVSYLSELVTVIKQQNIQWLIMEPYYEKRSAEFLNRKTGITTVVIPQSVGAKENIKTYFDLFDGIVAAFAEAK